LLKTGTHTGTIRVEKKGSLDAVGMVFQNADTQILCTTVEDEVAFGPLNLRLSSDEIHTNVENALQSVGLAGFKPRNVEQLSAGEKHRLTIASVLSMHPQVVLLDEPTAQLDAPGKTRLIDILKQLKADGHALLIADHDLSVFRSICDRSYLMRDGSLQEVSANMSNRGASGLPSNTPGSKADSRGSESPVAFLDGLSFDGAQNRCIFDKAGLTIYRGECIHLYGLNGTGKSTLLRCMVGLDKAETKERRIAGIENPRPEGLVGRVGMLFQNPDSQLFEDTVYDEVAYSLRRLNIEQSEVEVRVMDSLRRCGISHLAKRSPLTLSYGEKHRVALASVIAPRPELLLLDEPFSGLDFENRTRMLDLLSDFSRASGTSVLIASHDPLPDPNWADRPLILENGKIRDA
jgi:energy-coupling factor transport system ATP-binding protein